MILTQKRASIQCKKGLKLSNMGHNPVKLVIKTEMDLNPERKWLKLSNMGHDPVKLVTKTEMGLNPEQKRLKTFKHGATT